VELFKKAAVFEAQFFIEYTFEVAELKSQRWNLPEYSCNRLIQAPENTQPEYRLAQCDGWSKSKASLFLTFLVELLSLSLQIGV
jgi:hypothetical protein